MINIISKNFCKKEEHEIQIGNSCSKDTLGWNGNRNSIAKLHYALPGKRQIKITFTTHGKNDTISNVEASLVEE